MYMLYTMHTDLVMSYTSEFEKVYTEVCGVCQKSGRQEQIGTCKHRFRTMAKCNVWTN